MKTFKKILITSVLFSAPLVASQRPDVTTAMTNIKKLVAQDTQLNGLFSQNDTPEEVLEKAKIASMVTRFASIATELRNNLNPHLESSLGMATLTRLPGAPATTHQPQDYTTITQAAHNDELRSLREEIARLRAQEKERIETELTNFSNKLEQAKRDCATFSNVVNEAKERIVVFKHDLWQANNTILQTRSNGAIQSQIENMRTFFAQQITNLERCCGEMTSKTDQLKVDCDSLGWSLKRQAGNLADAQDKVREAWLSLNKIHRTVEEMQQLSVQMNDIKMLAVQTKFDLERRCDAAKKK